MLSCSRLRVVLYLQAELHRCVSQRLPSLLARGRVKLIVIDSVAALFRSNFAMEDAVRRAKQLTSLASQLHLLASRHTAAVICVNQVTSSAPTDSLCQSSDTECYCQYLAHAFLFFIYLNQLVICLPRDSFTENNNLSTCYI